MVPDERVEEDLIRELPSCEQTVVVSPVFQQPDRAEPEFPLVAFGEVDTVIGKDSSTGDDQADNGLGNLCLRHRWFAEVLKHLVGEHCRVSDQSRGNLCPRHISLNRLQVVTGSDLTDNGEVQRTL